MNLRFGQWTIAALLCARSAAPGWAEEEQTSGEATTEAATDTIEQSESQPEAENNQETAADPPPVPLNERQLPDTSAKQSLYLQEHMALFNREEELTQLSTGEETIFGLFLPETSGAPNGAVLILHDNQQHGHWPEVVAPLREYLPDYGWASLTLELPDAPQKVLPARTFSQSPEENTPTEEQKSEDTATEENQAPPVAEEANSEKDSEEAKDNQGPDTEASEVAQINEAEEAYEPALPRLEKLPEIPQRSAGQGPPQTPAEQQNAEELYLKDGRGRIKTAIEYLQQEKGQLNLAIIGVGVGAAWAVDYVSRYAQQLNPEEDNKGMVIITIDPINEDEIIPGNEQQMTDITVPYLELLTGKADNRQAEFYAKRRQGKMKGAKRTDYRQIRFTQLSSPEQSESDLGRRIRGWLKTNAGGTQIKLRD